jgi:hypothetical protein
MDTMTTTQTKTGLLRINPDDYCETIEIELFDRPLEWQLQGLSPTRSGYGSKIPTRWAVNYLGKNRRVYCTIYSNSGTCWITVNGQRLIVS